MLDKIPCQKCRAEILPRTAEKTGGVCMACKQGIRESIEESKEYYRRQKEYDPFRALWTNLVNKVHGEGPGFVDLTDEEKLYFSVTCFDRELYNGGMEQFFRNSSGDYYAEVVRGLTRIGASQSLSLLSRATEILFDAAEPPIEQGERWAAMKRLPESENDPRPSWDVELSEIDRRYCEDPDNITVLLAGFAEKTGLIQPFIRAAN